MMKQFAELLISFTACLDIVLFLAPTSHSLPIVPYPRISLHFLPHRVFSTLRFLNLIATGSIEVAMKHLANQEC
jgi:hypothetical protein